MAATVEDKSDVGEPNQFEDDQKDGLLPAEKKESDLNDPEKKKEGDLDDSNLPEKTRHPLGTSCKLFPLHAWLYFLYIVLAILLPIFGTLLIICGNWSNTGYFSLFAILNYPWPKLKLEDPNYTATSLELLQVSLIIKEIFFPNIKFILSWLAGSLASSSGSLHSTLSTPSSSTTSCSGTSSASSSSSSRLCSAPCSSPSSPWFSPGPGGRGTDRLGAACARLRTMFSAGERWRSFMKITSENLY